MEVKGYKEGVFTDHVEALGLSYWEDGNLTGRRDYEFSLIMLSLKYLWKSVGRCLVELEI